MVYRGVLEAAERFLVKWHEDEAHLSGERRAFAVGVAHNGIILGGGEVTTGEEWKETRPRKWGQRGGNRRGRMETAVDERRKETADRLLARHTRLTMNSKWNMFMLYTCAVNCSSCDSDVCVFFLCFACFLRFVILHDSNLVVPSFKICPYDRQESLLAAWMDDESLICLFRIVWSIIPPYHKLLRLPGVRCFRGSCFFCCASVRLAISLGV